MSRVLQLIDSLNAGGAERMAVTFANVLCDEIDTSYLCTTREEGILKQSLDFRVKYLYLKKQSSIDVNAIYKLMAFVKREKITVIHAHSTSYFLATMVKLLYPKIQIVWHDHYGNSEFLDDRPRLIIRVCSKFFKHVLVVNQQLANWAKQNLICKEVTYLPNFAVLSNDAQITTLKGQNKRRILCLANLRPQKDHLNLFKAFKQVNLINTQWTLHCVGQDFNDDYSKEVKQFVKDNNLQDVVYFYGSLQDVSHIISQCEIGVLSSKSEGLPVSLLEYALGNLAGIATDVGDCRLIINSNDKGILVSSEDEKSLGSALLYYIENESARIESAELLNKHVKANFSKTAVIDTLKQVYNINTTLA